VWTKYFLGQYGAKLNWQHDYSIGHPSFINFRTARFKSTYNDLDGLKEFVFSGSSTPSWHPIGERIFSVPQKNWTQFQGYRHFGSNRSAEI